MAAMYMVKMDDGRSVMVYSADAKSFKKRDVRTAYIKARKKAEAKYQGKAVSVRCVG
jgi:hypothetical protein